VRLLIVAKDFPSPSNPYAGIFVLRQAQALAEMGHEPLVVRVVPFAPPIGEKWNAYRSIPANDLVEGIPVRTIRAFFLPRMLASEFLPQQVGRALARIAARFAPDIVHAHFLIPSGQIAVRLPFPTVVTAHGSDAYDWAWRRPGLRRAASEAIRLASKVVAVSDFIRKRVASLSSERDDVTVIYNGADDRVFKPADRFEARSRLRLPAERFVVAFAGRPTHEKGAYDLIEALARLQHIRPTLLIAGPPLSADLRATIQRLHVDALELGMLSHAELAQAIAASDVFCLPSYNEGLPASICEAMVAGRPVIATPVGGIPEIVKDGETGYLVPVGDPRALARRLGDLAGDPASGARFGANARAFAQTRLTWRANAQRHERLYRQLLATPA
jgi:teichuronic acid biosynthesis glycosyltransferase TuaC